MSNKGNWNFDRFERSIANCNNKRLEETPA